MVSVELLQQYCKNKKIIIVGNSSGLLQSKSGQLIDSYDIVVRINNGYRDDSVFNDGIGTKTNIVSIGVKSATRASYIVKDNHIDFILSPIIWSDKLSYSNVHSVEHSIYHKLKEDCNVTKPSTGISTFNFFNTQCDFLRLDLIGFDFFQSSIKDHNALGHKYVKDHLGEQENLFFKRFRNPEKTILHSTIYKP